MQKIAGSASAEAVTGAVLELNGFGVTFGSKAVLSEVSFTVPDKGVVVLVGPKGTDRTTLLRTIAQFGTAGFSCQTSGSALYRGALLGEHEHPELVTQNAQLAMLSVLENVVVNLPDRKQLTQPRQRELAQQLLKQAGLQTLCERLDESMVSLPLGLQRHLSILRHIVGNPPLLCIDEPAAAMTDIEAANLFAYLRAESSRRALLVSVHHQKHARLLGGQAVLIVNGRIREQQPIPQIFDQPLSDAGREFARTGKCTVVNQEVPRKNLLEPTVAVDETVAVKQATSKIEPAIIKSPPELGKFLWLKRGMLAGTPAPGVHGDVEQDLKALQLKGVTTLLVLTGIAPDESRLKAFGMKSVLESIPEMGAPTMRQGIRICKLIESLLEQGEVVAVQGYAGLGRTGTILAAHLLWKGMGFDNALEYVRRVEPRWVQSQSQVEFLREFAQRV